MNGVQQLLQVVGGVGRVRNAVHRFLDALGAAARRHIPEAPDASHRTAVQPQRNRIPLEHAPVLEREDIETVRLRLGIPLLNPIHEQVWIRELVLHVRDQTPAARGIVVGGDELGRQVPHLLEVAVVRNDFPDQIDHQDPVGGRFERRLKD